MKKIIYFLIVPALLAHVTVGANESTTDSAVKYPDPQRWAEKIQEYHHWDSRNAYPRDAVLFVGSSSILYWKTADAFPGLPVINRGFGGSYTAEALYYVKELVLQYTPKVVIIYEGDNDIAGSIPPRLAHQDFIRLADAIHTALPQTEIICLAAKMCASRWDRRDAISELNQLNNTYSHTRRYITFVDTAAALLDDDGTTRDEFFMPDQLHLSESGYAQWNALLAPIVTERYRLALRKQHCCSGNYTAPD
jgi:lysophospholipase L1-like esterase